MSDLNIKEIRAKLGLNQEEFALAVGFSKSAIQKWENGSRNPDIIAQEKIKDIAQKLTEQKNKQGFSTAEFINVIEPNEQIPNSNGNVYEQDEDGKYRIYVKKVPVRAFGSYITHFQDADFFEELKQVSFPVSHVGRGNYICFEVQGDSMNGGSIDDTKAGAELLCRELGRQHWKDGFKSNDYGWVIIHKDTVLFKDIKSLDMENGDMVLGSRSGLPQHCDFTVSMNDIRQIWKVIKRTQ